MRLRRRHTASDESENAAIAATSWMLTERSPDGEAAPYVARIAGVGRKLPVTHLSTDALMDKTRHHTHVDLERLTGIHERRVSVGDEDSLSLAIGAARDCLARAGRRAEDIDLVVSCSITKYRDGLVQWLEPTTSLAVARAIGATSATTFDLSNACAGTLTGVLVANNWVRRGAIRRALVVSGEYISQLGDNAARHVRSVMSRELASLTLGDAGGAVLVERAEHGEPGIGAIALHHRGRPQPAVPRLPGAPRGRGADVHQVPGHPPGRDRRHAGAAATKCSTPPGYASTRSTT